jgi:hypothetical protein
MTDTRIQAPQLEERARRPPARVRGSGACRPILVFAIIAASQFISPPPRAHGATPQPSGPPAPPPDRIGQIAAAIQKSHDYIKNLKVEYTNWNELAVDDAAAIKSLIGTAYVMKDERSFAFKDGRLYYRDVEKEVREIGSAARGATDTPMRAFEYGYDGDKLRRKVIGGKVVDVIPTKMATSMDAFFNCEYLDAIGLVVASKLPRSDAPGNPALPEGLLGGGYRVLSESDAVDGEPCVAISKTGHDTIWLSINKNYAVKRRDVYDPGSRTLATRYLNSSFKEYGDGLWMPMLCIREVCGPGNAPEKYRGRPLVRFVSRVDRLDLNNVNDELFTLSIPAGSFVVDYSFSKGDTRKIEDSVVYTMPANNADLDNVINHAMRNKSVRWSKRMIWFAGSSLIFVIFLYVIFRKSRQSLGDSPRVS